jgi:RimJ/RimL family protein N-acetyltransferase
MLRHRLATAADVDLYYEWANDPDTRQQSFHQASIPYEQHVYWFNRKLSDPTVLLLVFNNEADAPVGQVRFETGNEGAVIGISIDRQFRGQGLAAPMIEAACTYFFINHPETAVTAYIKSDNMASLNSFQKAHFQPSRETTEHGVPSQILVRKSV